MNHLVKRKVLRSPALFGHLYDLKSDPKKHKEKISMKKKLLQDFFIYNPTQSINEFIVHAVDITTYQMNSALSRSHTCTVDTGQYSQ